MFDPKTAEPVFLEIIKRLPTDTVRTLGETILCLVGGDFAAARSTVEAGRRQMALTDPAQKALSALHLNIVVHERLVALGDPLAVDQIWIRADAASTVPTRETTVSHEIQKDLADEVKRQLVQAGSGVVVCPACGGGDCARVGQAPLVHAEDSSTSQEQKIQALQTYLDPAPLAAILRGDIANTDADESVTLRIVLSMAVRDHFTVPVARCGSCAIVFVGLALRGPGEAAAAVFPRQVGPGRTFLSAYEHALLPHWIWNESDLWTGASVFDFGCGSGVSLAHHALAGMRVAGYETDGGRAAYAQDVLGLSGVVADAQAFDAVADRSMTCVVSDHSLTRTTGVDRRLEKLCRMVSENGYLAIVAPNGEVTRPSDSVEGGAYPTLGGHHLVAFTPAILERRLADSGFKTVKVLRGPARMEDPTFAMNERDPFTGVPLWSARTGDFVVLAKRG